MWDTLDKALIMLTGEKMEPIVQETLEGLYSHREYHNMNHIFECMALMELYGKLSDEDHNRMVVAIYFHDALSNEEDSAELFEEMFEQKISHLDRTIIKYIIQSSKVGALQHSYLEHLMHDIDYAVLARESKEKYIEYIKGVEAEVLKTGLDERYFIDGRMRFLRNLSRQACIYHLEEFGKRFEWRARKNISWELEELDKRRKSL